MISSRWLVSGKYYSHEGGHRTAAQLERAEQRKMGIIAHEQKKLSAKLAHIYSKALSCKLGDSEKSSIWSFGGVVNALA